MTRIALLIPTLDQIGGAERQVLLLAKGFAARGLLVTVIVLSGSKPSSSELDSDRIEFLSLRMRKAWIDPAGWLRYLCWHRAHRPEIVHSHLPHATWFARFIRILAPARVVLETIHTSKTAGPLHCFVRRLSAPLSSHTTCVSNAVADSAVQALMLTDRNLTVLPNGVQLPASPAFETKPGIPTQESEFRWLAVGRLVPVKDYPTLLHAMALLPANAVLTIAGSGPQEMFLSSLTAALNLQSRVQFAGFQADIQPLLQRAHALVLSSLWEGLPMTILEAAAAGLPVVATSGAGTAEAMIDGHTGFLAPPAHPAALADAMHTMMSLSVESRYQMGRGGRQFVTQQFALEAIIDRWQQLYACLLTSHPYPTRWE